MLLVSLILSSLVAVMIPIAANVPWFLGITGTTGTINMGMLLSDIAGDSSFKPVFPGGWCSLSTTASALSTCPDYEILSFALYIVYHLSFIFQVLTIVACIKHWTSGLILQGVSLTFQSVALFGFFFRVLGLQQAVTTVVHGTVTSWSFGWGSYLSAASLILTWVTCIVYPLTYKVAPPPSPEQDDENNNNNEPAAGGGAEQQQQKDADQYYTDEATGIRYVYDHDKKDWVPCAADQQQQQQQQQQQPLQNSASNNNFNNNNSQMANSNNNFGGRSGSASQNNNNEPFNQNQNQQRR